jgi:hypothetical protein
MAEGGNSRAQRSQIERIVREVLAEVAARTEASAAGPPAPRSGGELALTNKVISTRELEGRLQGIARVVVSRGSVVTPAARDLLRQHRVTLATAVPAASRTNEQIRLVLGTTTTSIEPAGLIAMLSREGLAVERLPQSSMIDVIEDICRRVVAGSLGLVLSHQPAVALCLANRHRGVRAALAGDAAMVAAASDAVSPNVLIVDPAGKAMFEWQRVVRAWLAGGLPACPSSLAAHLE